MPNIINSESSSGLNFSEMPADGYEYEYPEGLDLEPGSPLHEFIKSFILEQARTSASVMSNNHDQWNQLDEKMTAYIPTTVKEEELKNKDRRKPVSVVFPYSFVIAETILSYLVSAFFPEPMFRYEGTSPEDIVGGIMLENVINAHCNRNKVALSLHTMFRDAIVYGMGVGVPLWTKKYGKKVVKQETGTFDFLAKFKKTGQERVLEDAILFEGNSLQNIDPYHYLPDPNVAVHDVQSGEFSGYVEETNLFSLLNMEQTDDDIFNVEYVKHIMKKKTSIFPADASKRQEKSGGSTEKNTTSLNPADVIWMNVTLIPNMFGTADQKLGDSQYPEKWSFGLAGDDVVIMAKPLGLTHDDYPTAVISPDFDGYSPTSVSRLAIEFGLQEILDWLLNSHIANVRKSINDMIIVDPYLVNINDLKDPGEGALIRLRRPGWGRGVDKVAQQLQINDITRNNIGDASFVMGMMDKVGAADNAVQGNLRQGGPERLTKSEFQGTMSGAVNRLGRVARVIGLMGMQDIGYFFAHHTQQLMSEETYVKTTGRWQETLQREYGGKIERNRMKVTPWDLLIDYDVMIRDGSVPGSNFSESWIQMYQILASNPELANNFEMVRIFKHIARGMGAKDVEQFERVGVPATTAQTMPDEQVADQVEKGNLLPLRS